MKVVVNSEEVDIAEGATLAAALAQVRIEAATGTAVAVDRRVVPREQWPVLQLADGSDIVVLNATQGG